jgi:hypothetical protein
MEGLRQSNARAPVKNRPGAGLHLGVRNVYYDIRVPVFPIA